VNTSADPLARYGLENQDEFLARASTTWNVVRATANEPYAPTRYGVCVAGLRLLIPVGAACEVVASIEVYEVPNTAPWFAGLVNLRGNLVPVFDLVVEAGHAAVPGRPLLVLNRGADAVALPVDRLPQVVGAPVEIAVPAGLPATIAPHVRAAYADHDAVWLDVALDALFESLGRSVGGA